MLILSKEHNFSNSDLTSIKDEGAVLLIDKQKDWTSFDIIAKLRSITRIKKIGHAGTLDPLATGLLIVCLSKATKQVNEYQAQSKIYQAEIKFGATTRTDDSEYGEENIISNFSFSNEELLNTCSKFIGNIQQIPPMFSAKKVNGKKLYELARKNKVIELQPSSVTIHSINLQELSLPFAKMEVNCSKGTYIRSLARDIGKELGVGAYLYNLRRTKIGEFSVESAFTITEIADIFDNLKKQAETNTLTKEIS